MVVGSNPWMNIFDINLLCLFEMTKINEKGAGDGPFLKVTVFHSTLGNNFMWFSDWHFICTKMFFPNQMAITCLGNIRYLHRDCVSSPMMRVYLVSDLVYLWIKEDKSSPLIWNHFIYWDYKQRKYVYVPNNHGILPLGGGRHKHNSLTLGPIQTFISFY